MDSIQVMNEANKIYEDFPRSRYAAYIALYLVEIAAAFWVAMILLHK